MCHKAPTNVTNNKGSHLYTIGPTSFHRAYTLEGISLTLLPHFTPSLYSLTLLPYFTLGGMIRLLLSQSEMYTLKGISLPLAGVTPLLLSQSEEYTLKGVSAGDFC